MNSIMFGDSISMALMFGAQHAVSCHVFMEKYTTIKVMILVVTEMHPAQDPLY